MPTRPEACLAASYLVGVVEFVVHEPGDDAGFANRLIPQKDLPCNALESSQVPWPLLD
jgi:hypothetical protein